MIAWLGRLLLLCGLFLSASAGHAQQFPKFTGFVVDEAGVIPPLQESAITQRLDQLQKKTGRQLVVLTVKDLQGYPIEDYGYKLGRSWGVGLRDVNNGAILIVAPNERKVRIEVGYGLEPVLTDALSSVIVNQTILPRFRSDDMAGGIEAGANAVADQLAAPDAEAKERVAKAAAEFDRTHKRAAAGGGGGGPPFLLLFWGVILLVIFISLARGRRRMGGYRASRYGGSDWPILLWTVANELNRGGRSDGWGGGSFGDWGGGGGDSGGGGWMGGGFSGGGGGSFGGGGASGSW